MNSSEPSFEFDVDRDLKMITIHLYGANTDEVFANTVTALLARGEYTRENYSVLVNALDMTVSEVTGTRIFNEAMRMEGHPNQIAIVMKDARGLGVAKIFEICSNATLDKVAVFTALDEARLWLGRPTPVIPE